MSSSLSGLGGVLSAMSARAFWFSFLRLPGTDVFYRPSPGYCFSNDAGTTPCGSGDIIKVWKSQINGRQVTQSNASQCPTLQLVNGYWAALYDGVDDYMEDLTYSSSPKLWCAAVNRLTNTGNFSGISNLITNRSGAVPTIRTNDNTHYRGQNAGANVNGGDGNDFSAGDTLWVNKIAAAAFILGTPHVVTSQRGTPLAFNGLRFCNQPGDNARLFNGYVYGKYSTTATLTTSQRGLLETKMAALYGGLL